MNDKNPNPDQRQKPNCTIYQTGEGPTSIDGVEASDLPDKGRGTPETSPGKELSRKLPIQTGATSTATDVGLTATPDAADARDHGPRQHN